MTHTTMVQSKTLHPRFWRRWGGIVLGTMGLLVLITLPPFVAPSWRAVLMDGFSAVCHQLPGRSPHVQGTALAVCHRCFGIYSGLALGVLLMPLLPSWARTIHAYARYALIGALTPLAADWLVDAAGLWANTPVSRMLTGSLVGLAAGMLVAYGLARRPRSTASHST